MGLALVLVLVFELGLAWHLVLGLVRDLVLNLILSLFDDHNQMPEDNDSQPYVTPNLDLQRVASLSALDPSNITAALRARARAKAKAKAKVRHRSNNFRVGSQLFIK
jgi:hypothetical protein